MKGEYLLLALACLTVMNAALAAEGPAAQGGAADPAAADVRDAAQDAPKQGAGMQGADAAGYYLFSVAADQRTESLFIFDGNNNQLSKPTLSSAPSWSPQFSLYTPSRYFDGSSHFGYNFYASYFRGHIDRQVDSGGNVVGTFPRVDVTQLDTGISVFASLGDMLVREPTRGTQFKIGAGIGPGYARVSGTVPAQFMTTGIAENIHSSGLGVSFTLFYRVTVNGFFLEGSGTAVKWTQRYNTNAANLLVGYTFPFRL